jgi:hypothetical protein
MKKTIYLAALAGALTFSGAAYADLADYLNNPGRQQAQSHQAPGCNAPFTGAGAGGSASSLARATIMPAVAKARPTTTRSSAAIRTTLPLHGASRTN